MANTKNNLIAKRYADALVSLIEENNVDIYGINSQLKDILVSLKESTELSEFMLNPVISADDKKDVISRLLADKIDDILINFIKLLIEKDRFSLFEDISNIFDAEVDKVNNVKRVNVMSAIEMTDELKNKLKEKLSYKLNKNVELVTEVNPQIIAGLVIKIDDNIIDLSLEHKFEEMKKEMIK